MTFFTSLKETNDADLEVFLDHLYVTSNLA